jgi:hypothetical protein
LLGWLVSLDESLLQATARHMLTLGTFVSLYVTMLSCWHARCKMQAKWRGLALLAWPWAMRATVRQGGAVAVPAHCQVGLSLSLRWRERGGTYVLLLYLLRICCRAYAYDDDFIIKAASSRHLPRLFNLRELLLLALQAFIYVGGIHIYRQQGVACVGAERACFSQPPSVHVHTLR